MRRSRRRRSVAGRRACAAAPRRARNAGSVHERRQRRAKTQPHPPVGTSNPVPPSCDHFGNARDAGGDHGHASTHREHHRQRQAFPERRHDEHIDRAEHVAEVAPRTEEMDALGQAKRSTTCARAAARSSPSPTTSSCSPASPGVVAIASNRCACAFCSVSRAIMPATRRVGRHAKAARATRAARGRRQLGPVYRVVDDIDPSRDRRRPDRYRSPVPTPRTRPLDRSCAISHRSTAMCRGFFCS